MMRALRRAPSDISELADWQNTCIAFTVTLFDEIQSKRMTVLDYVREAMAEMTVENVVDTVAELHSLTSAGDKVASLDAAKHILRPGSADEVGLRETCPFSWRFDVSSTSRIVDNNKALTLVINMLSKGFMKSETVVPDNNDLSSPGEVLFGRIAHSDSHARVTSAVVALLVIRVNKQAIGRDASNATRVMHSLLAIPT